MKTIAIISMILGLQAAEIHDEVNDNVQALVKIAKFSLPEDTDLWADSIMNLVRKVLPDDKDAQKKFQELVDWSCGEHADLKSADPLRRAETIRLSLDRLLAMSTSSARVAYIGVQLERHKQYVPKK